MSSAQSKAGLDDLEAIRVIVDALKHFDSAEQARILRYATEKIGLTGVAALPAPTAPSSIAEPRDTGDEREPKTAADIKSFYDEKKPSSDTQFAAVVAYYYRFLASPDAKKGSITKEDLQGACRLVQRRQPKSAAQTLVNAHQQGFLDRGDRGAYTINTVGENLVAMALPSDGGTSPARAKRATRKAKGRAKKPSEKRSAAKRSAPRKR